jgi:hypothetical protein
MGNPAIRPTMSEPAAYLIRVSGWLDASWTDYFANFSVVVSAPIGRPPETTLCGQVPDQTALRGMLDRLNHLGVKLLSVECLAAQLPNTAQA